MSRPPANQGQTGQMQERRPQGRGAREEARASRVPLPRPNRIEGLRLRPFGVLPQDLAIDFAQPSRACIGCQVLRCCVSDSQGQALDLSWFEGLTIGKRLECLAAVLAADGESVLTLQAHCSQPDCGGLMEVDLSLQEISALQELSESHDVAALDTT